MDETLCEALDGIWRHACEATVLIVAIASWYFGLRRGKKQKGDKKP
jgi:hypothetical protein